MKKFGIKTDDRRRHIYVVGKTGMGKTIMLRNMAIQDIQDGKGIAFVDPHGEAAEELLDFVPRSRINDVIYFNPADIEYPIAFNIMENVDAKYRHLIAGGLMAVFKKIWPDVWSARMEYILNNCILALLEYPGSTLLGVNRMLADVDYRKKIVEKVNDPMIKTFWVQEYARYTQRYEIEATAAIQNKIGQLISSPIIRNIIGQVNSTIAMREIMDQQKILIVNLSKGRMGEDNSRLLGALIITKLQLAAMSRVDILEQERKDFFLYVDEFQNFATESFVNVLSEARKYRLALILGHQYIAQMEDTVRDAVFGNVGTIISFRIGAEDAEFLEKEFLPDFSASDFVNLAKYNIYLKLMIDGVAGRPFSAETMAPLPEQKKSEKEKIIKFSRERYARPQKVIEEKISRWAGVENLKEAPQAPRALMLYDAKCSVCGKDTKVPFQPDGVRPVFCKSCRKKKEEEPPAESPAESGIESGKEKQEKETSISMEEAIKKEPMPFSIPKRPREQREKPKRKEVNLEELKSSLEEALDKEPENNNKEGIIKPGETVKF